jgi:hypothetical protein
MENFDLFKRILHAKSSDLPKIRKAIEEKFSDKTVSGPLVDVNPDKKD